MMKLHLPFEVYFMLMLKSSQNIRSIMLQSDNTYFEYLYSLSLVLCVGSMKQIHL